MASVGTSTPPSGVRMLSEKTGGPLLVPLATPPETSTPIANPSLTAEQQSKYDWLLERVKGWTEVPSTSGKAGALTDNEKIWLSKESLFRYLRATKWDRNEAEKRLLETLTWRRDYGVDDLTADYIGPENETGKQVIVGFDKQGRPCHYLNPGRQNTEVTPRQVQHMVFMLERVIDLIPAEQEKICLLIDFKTGAKRTNTAPGIGQGREVLHILQAHYPERLGRALIVNVPWVVWGFFKLITPFIDPLTKEKLKFNEDMTQYVTPEQLAKDIKGGQLPFEYDHSVYWPALMKLSDQRRAERFQRWEAGGKLIGESEDYLKGYAPHGVTGGNTEAPKEQATSADA
ncbi:CRAL-TRIO domain-containing protein [Xylaria bambusicola]|uniref:CRAL-TRIO domain-containing protein n=1 Tax=Xylaria bambusicola TaxID=326684 RepID=UPI00200798F2|nr:CRAL-TRIO domain-containing protein [Xylaria bambusicola]KAI0525705.1 CRAL-TRIO domain-containing protein [Xylaria bambusicola]